MTQYIRARSSLPSATLRAGVAALALAVAACGGEKKTDAALSQDTSLSRDLALANGADSTPQPQLQDVPAAGATPPATAPAPEPAPTPAPVRRPTTSAPRPQARPTTTRPAPAPATPRPTTTPAPEAPARTASGNTVTPSGGAGAGERSGVGSIPAGSTLALTSNSRVCTNTNKVGDRFTATVSEAVTGSNGATIPAGATATVEVTELKRSENARDKITMGFRIVSVSFGGRTYAVAGTTESADVQRVRNQPASKDREKVIGGAVIGAVAGQILGKDTKGTVIGAATGAAAGAAAAAATANYEGCVADGGRIRVRLTEAAQVRL